MESLNQQLDVMLVVSRKTYSLSNRKYIVKWETTQLDNKKLKFKYPDNAEIRIVEADIANRSLKKEFNELSIDWGVSTYIENSAKQLVNTGLTDILLYIGCLHLAIVFRSHSYNYQTIIIEAESLEALKSMFE